MKLIKKHNQKLNSGFTLSKITGKTKEVAARSRGFFLYPKIISFLLFITFGLLIARVYFSNQLAVSGGFVSVNSQRVSEITKENYQLENKLSELSSLSYIDAQAAKMGMVKVAKVEVLKTDSGVALKP